MPICAPQSILNSKLSLLNKLQKCRSLAAVFALAASFASSSAHAVQGESPCDKTCDEPTTSDQAGEHFRGANITLDGIVTNRTEFCAEVGQPLNIGQEHGKDYDTRITTSWVLNEKDCSCQQVVTNDIVEDTFNPTLFSSVDFTTNTLASVDYTSVGLYIVEFKWDDRNDYANDPELVKTIRINVQPKLGDKLLPGTGISDCYLYSVPTGDPLTTDVLCDTVPQTSTTVKKWLADNKIAASGGSDQDLQVSQKYFGDGCDVVDDDSTPVGDSVAVTVTGDEQDISVPGEYTVWFTWHNNGEVVDDNSFSKKLTIKTHPESGPQYSALPEALTGELTLDGELFTSRIICLAPAAEPIALEQWLSNYRLSPSGSDSDVVRDVTYGADCETTVGPAQVVGDAVVPTRSGTVDFTTTGTYPVTWVFANAAGSNAPDTPVTIEVIFNITEHPEQCGTAVSEDKFALIRSILGPCFGLGSINGQAPQGESAGGTATGRAAPTDPVNLATGELILQETDLVIPGRGFDFRWVRTYGSRTTGGALGNGWQSLYDLRLEEQGLSRVLFLGTEAVASFVAKDNGTWFSPALFAEVTKDPATGLYTLLEADQTRLEFRSPADSIAPGKLHQIRDRNGNSMSFGYNSSNQLETIIDTLGRTITVSYTSGRVSRVTDFTGRYVEYAYYGPGSADGSAFDLMSVTSPAVTGTPTGNDFPNGKTTSYTYSTGSGDDQLNHNLLTITDGKGQLYLLNQYSAATDFENRSYDRVVSQRWGNPNEVTTLSYHDVDSNGASNNASKLTIVNDRAGNVQEYYYGSRNKLKLYREYTGRSAPGVQVTKTAKRPMGKLRPADPDYFETRYSYGKHDLLRLVEKPNGNLVEYVYETDINSGAPRRSKGNLRYKRFHPGTHLPAGEQTLLEEQFEYDSNFGCGSCGYNLVKRYTDRRANVTEKDFDANGNTLQVRYPVAGTVEDFTYNNHGQVETHSLPANDTGHRQVNTYTYYSSGPHTGYLESITEDSGAGGLNLTTYYEYDAVGNPTRITTAKGLDQIYIYNQLNQLVRVRSSAMSVSGVRYEKDVHYDANNNIVKVDTLNVDDDGTINPNPYLTTSFTYDILNNPVTRTVEVSPSKTITSGITYDANRNRTGVITGEASSGADPFNKVSMLYDERDKLYRVIRGVGGPDQSSAQFDYDGNGNVVATHEGLEQTPRVTSHIYDGFDRLVSTTGPMGNQRYYAYDANNNQTETGLYGELDDVPGSAQNVLLDRASAQYDALNRLYLVEEAFFDPATGAPIGNGVSATTMGYTPNSQKFSVTGPSGYSTWFSYDRANRLQSVTDAKSNSRTFSYDDHGNMESLTEKEISDIDQTAKTYVTDYEYDNNDRLVKVVDPAGNRSEFRYDSRGNLTTSYDAVHASTAGTLGNKVNYTYDGLDRLVTTVYHMTSDGTGAGTPAGTVVNHQLWDDSSRLVGRIDGNSNKTSYLYDSLNRMTHTVRPDGAFEKQAFTVHDDVFEVRDPNGNIITNTWSPSSNLAARTIQTKGAGGTTVTLSQNMTWSGGGQLRAADWTAEYLGLQTLYRQYDSLGNLTRETVGAKTTAAQFDPAGNRTRYEYPGGSIVETAYDSLNRPQVISVDGQEITRYWYEGPSRVARRDNGNGTRISTYYDGVSNAAGDYGDRQPVRTLFSKVADNTILGDFRFTYDQEQRRTSAFSAHAQTIDGSRQFVYDSIGRMWGSNWTPPAQATISALYYLDAAGNREQVYNWFDTGMYTTNENNQYMDTPNGPRSYDANGNTLSSSVASGLQYDWENRLLTRTSAAGNAIHGYDPLGRLFHRYVYAGAPVNQKLSYDGWHNIESDADAAGHDRTYFYGTGIDEIVREKSTDIQTGAQQELWYLQDPQMSVRVVTDSAGNAVTRLDYDNYGVPFGMPAGGNEWEYQFGYTGRPWDASVGAYDYRTRHHDPRLGRFMQSDSIGAWGDPMNMGNAYTYTGNAPWTWTDPYGLAGGGYGSGGTQEMLNPQTGHPFGHGFANDSDTIQSSLAYTPPALNRAAASGLLVVAGATGTVMTGGFGGAVFGALFLGQGALDINHRLHMDLYSTADGLPHSYGDAIYMANPSNPFNIYGCATVDSIVIGAPIAYGAVNLLPSRTLTSGDQVTEAMIRNAMRNAELISQQSAGISLPRVQSYVGKLLNGQKAPPIKIDGRIIVDGNHRYVAGRLVGKEPAKTSWSGGRPDRVVEWKKIPIKDEVW